MCPDWHPFFANNVGNGLETRLVLMYAEKFQVAPGLEWLGGRGQTFWRRDCPILGFQTRHH